MHKPYHTEEKGPRKDWCVESTGMLNKGKGSWNGLTGRDPEGQQREDMDAHLMSESNSIVYVIIQAGSGH
jgi:hypothetical protein